MMNRNLTHSLAGTLDLLKNTAAFLNYDKAFAGSKFVKTVHFDQSTPFEINLYFCFGFSNTTD